MTAPLYSFDGHGLPKISAAARARDREENV